MHDYFKASYKHGIEHLRKLHQVIQQAKLRVESRFPYSLCQNQLLMFYLQYTSFLS